jgi:hypothetical protein
MLNKLTLTIDDKVIANAKKYAHRKNKSVSRIVEEYLELISDEDAAAEPGRNLEAPLTAGITGMFIDTGEDYNAMLENALTDKHK